MTNLTRAKNYSEFCENWRNGVPCYYTGWKALTCDGTSIMLNRGGGRSHDNSREGGRIPCGLQPQTKRLCV